MVVDDENEKHVCNDEGNYIIANTYNCDENDTYLLDQLCPFIIRLHGVNNVRSIVKNIKLLH